MFLLTLKLCKCSQDSQQALEAGNAELEGKLDSELEGFLQRL